MKTKDMEQSSLSEIAFWSWVAGAVILLLVFASMFTPVGMQRIAENAAPTAVEGMMPPITQPAPSPLR